MGKEGGCCCGEKEDLGVDPMLLLEAGQTVVQATRGFIQGRRGRLAAEEAAEFQRQMLEAQRIEAEQKAARQKTFLMVGGSLLLIGAVGYTRMQEND